MLKKFWAKLTKWIAFQLLSRQQSNEKAINKTPQYARNSVKVSYQLYSRSPFRIGEQDKIAAEPLLFTAQGQPRQGPTKSQQQVIFSNAGAVSVLAGAGSGKSTTLISRVLFLHKILGVPLENIAVFTFTCKSRIDFIEKLVKESANWKVKITNKQAEKIVRTFHSKALQIASSAISPGTKIFEFIGKNKAFTIHTDSANQTSNDDLSESEKEANQIDGFIELDKSVEQAEILKLVYNKSYSASFNFRRAIAALFLHTIRTQPYQADEKFNALLTHLNKISTRDLFLCEHLEGQWKKQNCWPIPGVVCQTENNERFKLEVYGKTLYANGYIPKLDTYIILGEYDGIPNEEINIGKVKFKPKYAVKDKRILLLTASDKHIRYLKNEADAAELKQQITLFSEHLPEAAPAFNVRLPGEYSSNLVFSALFNLGTFAENLGLDPSTLSHAIPPSSLSAIEKFAIEAVSIFYSYLYVELKNLNIITLNQIFSMLSEGSPSLEKIDICALMNIKHLMIDEFQDISPLIVNFVRGIHSELMRKSDGLQQPSLLCVGDDWQSIYGWRGSSPHFLLESFSKDFPGACQTPILLQENFRSSQLIIDCGERFINLISKRSYKKGIASHPAVKELPYKVISVSDYATADVIKTLNELLEHAKEDEEVYLLAATHADLDKFKHLKNKKLMLTTFHQSKGLEATYVVLIGANPIFGANNLKNELYKLAEFPKSFDAAQRDEALRVAYVAATRAKKFCIWFAKPFSNNAVERVPADGQARQSIEASEIQKHLSQIVFSHTS